MFESVQDLANYKESDYSRKISAFIYQILHPKGISLRQEVLIRKGESGRGFADLCMLKQGNIFWVHEFKQPFKTGQMQKVKDQLFEYVGDIFLVQRCKSLYGSYSNGFKITFSKFTLTNTSCSCKSKETFVKCCLYGICDLNSDHPKEVKDYGHEH